MWTNGLSNAQVLVHYNIYNILHKKWLKIIHYYEKPSNLMHMWSEAYSH